MIFFDKIFIGIIEFCHEFVNVDNFVYTILL